MLKINDKVPDFSLPSVDGKKYSPKDFPNKIIAVIFTCNHCPYAQAYQDRLIAFQSDYSGKAQIVAINSNDEKKYPQDSFDEMKIRAKEKGFNFPYLRDESQDIARKYGAEVTPHIFILDKGHVLKYKGAIDNNWQNEEAVTRDYLRDAVNSLLKGKEIAEKETKPVGCSIKWRQLF